MKTVKMGVLIVLISLSQIARADHEAVDVESVSRRGIVPVRTAPAAEVICHTSDKKYSLVIKKDKINPIGFASGFNAEITDKDGEVVGEFTNLMRKGSSGSISFGHPSIVDEKTGGEIFDFAYPSTNTMYGLTAKLKNGKKINYGGGFKHSDSSKPTLDCE